MYFGVDLGTTNSVISTAKIQNNGKVIATPIDIDRAVAAGYAISDGGKIIYTKGRKKTLPSCVYYGPDGITVGDFAREQYKKYPELVAKSVKSQMGSPTLQGLSETVPDKTPEAVSAKILSHLKTNAEMMVRRHIKDAVITVPANFDTAQMQATMRAAELAGFRVKDENGNWRPILISEPSAVLYDLLQKITNGEVESTVFDTTTKKKVIVFDIGGGTLDVTFHEVERGSLSDCRLNISEIGKSRYTRLAGDDFDDALATTLYARCIDKLRAFEPGTVQRIQRNAPMVKKMLSVAAEQLKLDFSARMDKGAVFSAGDDWFGAGTDDMDAEEDFTCDVSVPIGDEHIYNDTLRKSEFEAAVAPFLGCDIRFDDYKNYAANPKRYQGTILAPVLDVLEKAARYYAHRGETLSVDAVILNGGMSKLYLIKDRLRTFFGFEPIVTADPDLSVANGAAVYACILAQSEATEAHFTARPLQMIEIVRHIQNENLYLGLSAGAVDPIITEGTELPFSVTLSGYKPTCNTRTIEFPIKKGTDFYSMPVIARGTITFPREISADKTLSLEISVDQSGLLSIRAHQLSKNGTPEQTGITEITVCDDTHLAKHKGGERLLPRGGSNLIPAYEINGLLSLYNAKNPAAKGKIKGKIATVCNCGNPEDFEPVILDYLKKNTSCDFKRTLLHIAGCLREAWSEAGRKELKNICRQIVNRGPLFCVQTGPQRELYGQAREILANAG